MFLIVAMAFLIPSPKHLLKLQGSLKVSSRITHMVEYRSLKCVKKNAGSNNEVSKPWHSVWPLIWFGFSSLFGSGSVSAKTPCCKSCFSWCFCLVSSNPKDTVREFDSRSPRLLFISFSNALARSFVWWWCFLTLCATFSVLPTVN